MEFTVETTYDHSAMKALARGLRKTLRRKRSRRSHIFGTVVIIIGILLLISTGSFDIRSLVTAAAVLAILYALLKEDDLNGRIALKRNLPGMDHAVTTFREENYHSVTTLGETTFSYENIAAMAETEEYFLLLFSPSHGQVYAKAGLAAGTMEQLRGFLEEKTGKKMQKI